MSVVVPNVYAGYSSSEDNSSAKNMRLNFVLNGRARKSSEGRNMLKIKVLMSSFNRKQAKIGMYFSPCFIFMCV